MGEMRQISVTLPSEVADALRARVASGQYASEREEIVEGLLALDDRDLVDDRDPDIEDWLRSKAAATYDAMLADPSRGLSSGEVKAALARARGQQ